MTPSILLSLDGSIYAVHAANLCFRLANAADASVLAHHVVDTEGAREFVIREPEGFVSAKEYKSVYDYLSKSLWAIGQQLKNRYLNEAAKYGVTSSFVLEEGDPVTAVCERAKAHDLVVIGHHHKAPLSVTDTLQSHKSVERSSFAEALTHNCPVPLLVVQDDGQSWNTMSILVSLDHLNEKYIDACLDTAELLNLKPIIVCLGADNRAKSKDDIICQLRQANPRTKDIEINFSSLEDLSVTQAASDSYDTTLPVVPTRAIAGARVSLLDVNASAFVHCLTASSMLLMPEEYLEYKRHSETSAQKLEHADIT